MSPYRVLLIFVASALLMGCKKETTEPAPPTNSELLTRHGWIVTAVWVQNNPGDTPVDVFPGFAECNRDDIWDFRTDGRLVILSGAMKCTLQDPDEVEHGTWSWHNGEEYILFADSVKQTVWQLLLLNDTALTLKYTGYDSLGNFKNSIETRYRAN